MSVIFARSNTSRTHWFRRIRMQLGGGLILAVILPYVARYRLDPKVVGSSAPNISLLATFFAVCLGCYIFRMLHRYPGTRAYFNIIPTFAASYGCFLIVVFFFRVQYSIAQIAMSFIVCIAWFHFILLKLRREGPLTIGVVPVGDINRLLTIESVLWLRLSNPNECCFGCEAIVADLRSDMPEEWRRFLADEALAGTLIMHVKQLEESLTGRVSIEHLSENNLGSLIPGIIYAKIKRIVELVLTVIAIPLLTPLMLLVSVLIKLDTSGPVFFTQDRMGYRGTPFRIYKFRSMEKLPKQSGAHTASDILGDAITKDRDKRVTFVGKYIRRFRIDELPQIINILKGEMSWIGPRPEADVLSMWYEVRLPFYRYRHIVRPGITGWAQVNQGHVAELSEVDWKLQYDFYYIKNFSFWLDLLIIARTFKIIINGFGAR